MQTPIVKGEPGPGVNQDCYVTEEREWTLRGIISTMTYDLCGIVHAGVMSNHPGCDGCGACLEDRTWGLLRELHVVDGGGR